MRVKTLETPAKIQQAREEIHTQFQKVHKAIEAVRDNPLDLTTREAVALRELISSACYRNAATGEPDELVDQYRDRLQDLKAAPPSVALSALKKLDAACLSCVKAMRAAKKG